MPFVRVIVLLLVCIWALTVGLIGMLLLLPIWILFGPACAESWYYFIQMTGNPLMDFFEEM